MILCQSPTPVSDPITVAEQTESAVWESLMEIRKMIPAELVEPLIGHDIGGVCPFGINEGVKVYLDISLKKHEVVYPAVGSYHSGVRLTIPELEDCSGYTEWVDVCREET